MFSNCFFLFVFFKETKRKVKEMKGETPTLKLSAFPAGTHVHIHKTICYSQSNFKDVATGSLDSEYQKTHTQKKTF